MDEAIALARVINNQYTLAWALIYLGATGIDQPSGYETSLAAVEEGLAIFKQLDNQPGIAQALNIIGELTRTYGDDKQAKIAYESCLAVVRETGELRREAMLLGNIAMHHDEIDQAERLIRDALDKTLALGHDKHLLIANLVALAGVFGAKGDLARAVRLFGAAEVALEALGLGLMPGDQSEYERDFNRIRPQLEVATFHRYWNEGRAMSLDQMITNAREA